MIPNNLCTSIGLIATTVFLVGCPFRSYVPVVQVHSDSEATGTITVGYPTIYTRESLVRERADEIAFLREQLAAFEDDFGFQGIIQTSDVRISTGTVGVQGNTRLVGRDKARLEFQRDEFERLNAIEELRQKERIKNVDRQARLSDARLDSEIRRLESQTQSDLDRSVISSRARSKALELLDSDIPDDKKLDLVTGLIDVPNADVESKTDEDFENTKAELAKLTQQLAELKVPGEEDSVGIDNSLGADALTKLRMEIINLRTASNELNNNEKPDNSNFKPLSAEIASHPRDTVDEMEALRQHVQNKIRLQQLDESHDANGNTLYALQFDVSVFPTSKNSSWAKVDVLVGNGTGADDDHRGVRNFERWCLSLQGRVRGEVRDLIGRTDRYTVTETQRIAAEVPGDMRGVHAFAAYDARWLLAANLGPEYTEFRDTGSLLGVTSEHRQHQVENAVYNNNPIRPQTQEINDLIAVSENRSGYNKTLQKIFAARSVLRRFLDKDAFGDYITGRVYLGRKLKNQSHWVGIQFAARGRATCAVHSETGSYFKWKQDIEKLGESSPNVYAVTPRESYERIADVATRQELRQIGLALNAVVGNIGVGAEINRLRNREAILQAVRHQPVVLGYSGESKKPKFGWLFGPRYSIARQGTGNDSVEFATFTQVPDTHTVSALVAVPAWWDKLKITINPRWINQDGAEFPSSVETIEYLADVSGDPEAITAAMAKEDIRVPVITNEFGSDRSSRTVIAPNRAASLVIEGDDLWRDPVVTIGSQKATRVEVLPGMKGIIAHFDAIDPNSVQCFAEALRSSIEESESRCDVGVVVWTSRGHVSAGNVTLLADSIQDAPLITATVQKIEFDPNKEKKKEKQKPIRFVLKGKRLLGTHRVIIGEQMFSEKNLKVGFDTVTISGEPTVHLLNCEQARKTDKTKEAKCVTDILVLIKNPASDQDFAINAGKAEITRKAVVAVDNN